MTSAGCPSDRKYIPGVKLAPVIKRAPPTVKGDEDRVVLDAADGRRTDEVRVFPVDRLQLHADLEEVLGWCWRLLLVRFRGS